MKLYKCMLTSNRCYTNGTKIIPKGIMVHSTGANNPTIKRYAQPSKTDPDYDELMKIIGTNQYNNDWNDSSLSVSVHAFIGKLADGSIGTVQTLPWNYKAWHCASGAKGSGNNTYIAFEICEDGMNDKTYFDKVYKEAVELTAKLCKEYNLDPMADGVVICHSEGYRRGIASGHADVMHWFPKFGKNMDIFRANVNALVKGEISEDSDENTTTEIVAKDYVVQAGDSWWKIAAIELGDGLRYDELAKYNGVTSSTMLHTGDIIKIPTEVKIEKEEDENMEDKYSDVASWAKEAWIKAVDKGILDGSRPEDNLTRQELAIVLDRLGLLD